MDTIQQLQKAVSYFQSSMCEEAGCQDKATHMCQTDDDMIICTKCKDEEHPDCALVKYHSPYDLSSLTWQLNVILVNVDLDCAKLKAKSIVNDIRSQLKDHRRNVEELTKTVLSWLKLEEGEYKEQFSQIYKDVLKARNELKKCLMNRGPYIDKFIPYHITDMSIVHSRKI